MQNCSNLCFLTTLAYQLADCLSGDELTILAADLVAMADLLANIVARNDFKSQLKYWTICLMKTNKKYFTIYKREAYVCVLKI